MIQQYKLMLTPLKQLNLLAVSSRDALIALLDNMPQMPFLNAPTIDPQIVITDSYNPALREWKNKVRAIAENV
jgi:hypothetical protein